MARTRIARPAGITVSQLMEIHKATQIRRDYSHKALAKRFGISTDLVRRYAVKVPRRCLDT